MSVHPFARALFGLGIVLATAAVTNEGGFVMGLIGGVMLSVGARHGWES